MKRLATLLLSAALLLGGASYNPAQAVDIKAGGDWEFVFGYMDASLNKHDGQDNFYAQQRIRQEFRFITDKNLQAVLQLEIGTCQWGSEAWGMGADANDAVKVRYGYVDWVVPGLGTKVRMGAQNLYLPKYTIVDPIGPDDVTGIAISHTFPNFLAANVFWARLVNNSGPTSTNQLHNEVDALALALTFKGDGYKVSPYGMAVMVGDQADWTNANRVNGDQVQYLGYGLLPVGQLGAQSLRPDSETGWFAGIGGELTLFDPFKLGVDFTYGHFDFGTTADGYQLKRAGWQLSALATYKLDFGTPGIHCWYSSGDDSNPYNGSERMPFLYQNTRNFEQLAFNGPLEFATKYGRTITGTWGVQLRFDDFSFVDKLSNTLRFAYMQGTNDKAMVEGKHLGAKSSFGKITNVHRYSYLTEKDHAFIVGFDTKYQIYKNLSAELNLVYMKYDYDENVWKSYRKGGNSYDDEMYMAAVYMRYRF